MQEPDFYIPPDPSEWPESHNAEYFDAHEAFRDKVENALVNGDVLMIEVGDSKYERDVCDDICSHTSGLISDINKILEQHGLKFVEDREYKYPNWLKYELFKKA